MTALAIINECPVREPNNKWVSMTPDERRAYATRVRVKSIQLMTARAAELGLQGSDITERTGYTTSWVSKVNKLKTTTQEALTVFATSTGYPHSFYLALAEDLIEAEDRRMNALIK